jgi:hypothetical protein
MCWVKTSDGRLVRAELDVSFGCAIDWEKNQGFLLDDANQYKGEDGNWYQICSDLSVLPVSTINPSRIDDLKVLLGQIFHRSQSAEKQKQYDKAKHNDRLKRMQWIIVFTCITVMIIFGMQLLWGD